MITFTVPGEPVAMPQGKVVYMKNMPRADGGKGRMLKVMPKHVTDWKTTVGMFARASMRGRELFTGPLIVGFCYYRSRPKKVPEGGVYAVPIQRPDLENYDELVADSCTGVVYEDDSQIVGHLGYPCHGKHYTDERGPRTCVVVMHLNEWDETLAMKMAGNWEAYGR